MAKTKIYPLYLSYGPQWLNRLERGTYKAVQDERCRGCEFEPHLEQVTFRCKNTTIGTIERTGLRLKISANESLQLHIITLSLPDESPTCILSNGLWHTRSWTATSTTLFPVSARCQNKPVGESLKKKENERSII